MGDFTKEEANRIFAVSMPQIVNPGPPGVARFRCARCGGAFTNDQLWYDDGLEGWACLSCGPDVSDLGVVRFQDLYRGDPYDWSGGGVTHIWLSQFDALIEGFDTNPTGIPYVQGETNYRIVLRRGPFKFTGDNRYQTLDAAIEALAEIVQDMKGEK